MKYLYLYIVMILVGCGSAAYCQTTKYDDLEAPLIHDLRAVEDLEGLPLDRISENQQDEWVILHVKPDALSGFYSSRHPRNFDEPLRPASLSEEDHSGTYQVTGVLTRCAKVQSGIYHWLSPPYQLAGPEEPQEAHDFLFDAEMSSPVDNFAHEARNVICRINEGKLGYNRFDPVYLCPNGWESYVKEAVTYVSANHSVLNDATNNATLFSLIDQPNPFLKLYACNKLVARRAFSPNLIGKSLRHSTGLLQAAITILAISQSSKSIEPIRSVFESAITDTDQSHELLGILLGAYHERVSAQHTSSQSDIIKSILIKCHQKEIELHTHTVDDAMIHYLLEQVDLPIK